MPATWWDLRQDDRRTSWRRIRALRSSRDVGEADRLTYVAALEQAQQLLEAAESVGTATRALPLYYGLNQACRAIACAIQPGASFESHGLATNERSLRGAADPLATFTVRGNGDLRSGWTVMSGLLGSAAMRTAQPIRLLWGMVVETQVHLPRLPAERPSLFVQEDSREGWLVTGIRLRSDNPGVPEFEQMQAEYPGLRGASFGGFQDSRGVPDRTWNLAVGPPTNSSEPVGTLYREGRVLMPAVEREAATLHPLMMWWAILYPLSILSRYEPATWNALIDLDTSPAAVHLEALMEEALDSVPALIHQALTRAPDMATAAGPGGTAPAMSRTSADAPDTPPGVAG